MCERRAVWIVVRTDTRCRGPQGRSLHAHIPLDDESWLAERLVSWGLDITRSEDRQLETWGQRVVGCVVLVPLETYKGVLTPLNQEAKLLWRLYHRPADAYFMQVEDAMFLPPSTTAYAESAAEWSGFTKGRNLFPIAPTLAAKLTTLQFLRVADHELVEPSHQTPSVSVIPTLLAWIRDRGVEVDSLAEIAALKVPLHVGQLVIRRDFATLMASVAWSCKGKHALANFNPKLKLFRNFPDQQWLRSIQIGSFTDELMCNSPLTPERLRALADKCSQPSCISHTIGPQDCSH